MGEKINVWGARVHNLKNIDVEIPRDSLTVITGLSGSGKSSLAFDTLYAEGQRRYVESLSSYARQFLGRMNKPECDYIKGIPPAIAIEQKVISRNPRSTVGTTTEIYEYLRLLFARVGHTFSPVSGNEVKKHTAEDVLECVKTYSEGTKLYHCADCGAERPDSMPAADLSAVNSILALGDAEGKLDELRRRYPTFEKFKSSFEMPKDVIDKLIADAAKDKVVPKNDDELKQTMPQLKLQLKALVARDLWDMSQYFDIINGSSHIVQKAIEIMK